MKKIIQMIASKFHSDVQARHGDKKRKTKNNDVY